jgi:serine/threonine protein kinase
MAPEIVNGNPHNYLVDIWSLGILLYEMIHRKTPFSPKTLKRKNLKPPKFSSDIDPSAKDLILKILQKNPKERIALDQIFTHSWVTANVKTVS